MPISHLHFETWFYLLFRNNPTMVVILDADLHIVAANPRCVETLGYSLREIEGTSVQNLFHKDDRTAVTEELLRCLDRPGETRRWNFRKVCKDGATLWVEELVQAVPGRNGELNILVVCQDLTEERRAKGEIERLNAELRVRADDLEVYNRELYAFSHTAAHDLRQPLSILSIYCQEMGELCGSQLTDDCKEMLQNAYNLTLRMDQMIAALLKFSHMGTIDSNRQLVNLSMLAQEVAQTLKLLEPDRDVNFEIQEGVIAYCDKNLLKTVLENLLGNAWKYTGTRERASIRFGFKDFAGMSTYFVWDNGVGFKMEDAKKLFTPFLRLPSEEKCRGFGIGLATVERIIQRHGGKVWAEGELGEWACFYFTLNGGQ